MKLAIITLTTGGVYYAKQIKKYYPEAIVYTIKKHLENEMFEIQPSLKKLVGELFGSYDGILFIMATGIVVRTIAPFIKHKTIDPAIMVMDEKGKFVISLLSGHIGRANEWTIDIAGYIGALPVITTATDVNEKMAVDILAEKLGCAIDDMKSAKEITVDILENKKIGILSEIPVNVSLKPPLILLEEDIEERKLEEEGINGLIIVSKEAPKKIKIPYSWLMPKDIVIGIGCRRGKTKNELMNALITVLETHNINLKRVSKLATVDIKSDEIGLLELASYLKVPLECIPKEAIRNIEEKFGGSEFVQKTLGVKAVSEPCGYLGSERGRCIIPQQKLEGITISIWEKLD